MTHERKKITFNSIRIHDLDTILVHYSLNGTHIEKCSTEIILCDKSA